MKRRKLQTLQHPPQFLPERCVLRRILGQRSVMDEEEPVIILNQIIEDACHIAGRVHDQDSHFPQTGSASVAPCLNNACDIQLLGPYVRPAMLLQKCVDVGLLP